MSNTSTIQNNNIQVKEDYLIAEYLRKRNLVKTNKTLPEAKPRHTFYTKVGKRICDIIISIPCVIALLPIYPIISLIVYFNMGRPILYKQSRVGLNGKVFNVLKYRSMSEKKDSDGNLLPPHMRVTKFGKFIRKYSIDELPQFINILRGDMSIIGPRPLPVFFIERMSERHKKRDSVRPGLECPRVIEGEGEQYNRQFENDIWYVENISLLLDIKMIIRLFVMTFLVKERISAEGGSYFAGYDDNCRAIYKDLAIEMYPQYKDSIE